MAYQTKQKRAVAAALRGAASPLTPQQILETASGFCPGIGMATVYRCLRAMIRDGQARPVEIPGAPPHYEIQSPEHHHYFFCEKCKKVFDIEGCVEGWKALVPEGFRVTHHEITIYGECAGCAEA